MLVLGAAREQYRSAQRLSLLGLTALRRARGSSSPERLAALLAVFQLAAVRNVTDHTAGMLEEQGIRDAPVASLAAGALVGVASDGRDLGSLLTLPDLTAAQFDRIVATQLQDVARQAAAIERAVRPQVTHYVRALNLPSCGRCVVLAGKPERSDVAFRRHPRCDCLAVPSNAANAGRLATDPVEAFDAMTAAEREKAFTKAGAEAIGLGADVGRVVNARSGMDTAQVFGRDVKTTGALRRRYGRGPRGDEVRLMPESIAQIATDRDDHLRLLRLYGYITD